MNGKNTPLGDCGSGCKVQQSPEELSEDVISSITGSRSRHQKWCSGAMWHVWSCFQRFVCNCFLLSWAWEQWEPTLRSTCYLVFVRGNHMALSVETATILSLPWWPGKAKSWWQTPVFVCKAFSFSILLLSISLILFMCVSNCIPVCFH